MSEDKYRICKLILLATLVIGGLVIGFRWAANGRYVQFDEQKSYSPDGKVRPVSRVLFDTRTGRIVYVNR